MEAVRLPLKTDAAHHGPVLRFADNDLRLYYDWQGDDGTSAWVKIDFFTVLAFRWDEWTVRRPTSALDWVDSMIVFSDSKWRTELLSHWEESVGSHPFQQARGGSSIFKHYSLYIDDCAMVDVLAEGYGDISIVDPPSVEL